ncbi:MAG: M20/M25/M40 family metallo-hydrolase [Bacteroidota bacterium]
MNTINHHFLYEYLNNKAPVTREISGQKIWLNYIKPYIHDYFVDVYGNAVGIINPQADYKVVIEAHADEISWYVNYITKEGYIYVIRNGGSDYQIAPSMRATIHGEQGDLPAVFGWPAIHVRKEREKTKMNVENIVLDAGFSSQEEASKKGVEVGSIVTFDRDLCELNGKFWTGRALDNRIGGVIIAEVARMLHEKKTKLPFGLYIVNAVQEEVGRRGAAMITEKIKPNLALITDVTHDTQSPHYSKIKNGDIACGKGPVLFSAPSVQPKVYAMLMEVAKKNKIPFQRSAAQYETGTDIEAFAYSNAGTPSGLLSQPIKYMHTTVETVHQDDVVNTVRWKYEFLRALQANHSFKFDL